MSSIRSKGKAHDPEPPERLPLRWAVILTAAAAAAIPAGFARGYPTALGVFFAVASTLHMMVA